MSSQASRISHLVSLIEDHPQSSILLPLIEHIFVSSDSRTKIQLIQSFHQLCYNDPNLLFEFEIIRGAIALEEGYLSQAFDIFWEILHHQKTPSSSWNQVIEIFVTNQLFIHASLFLRIALDRFPQIPHFVQLTQEISHLLADQLDIPPGVDPSKFQSITSERLEPDIVHETSLESESVLNTADLLVLPNLLSSSVSNYWDQALECFEEFSSSQNSLNARGFVHYAHLTVRELLGVEGSFREGIDQRISFYQLSQFRDFLIWLNQIRNKIFHDDYLPTQDQITQIYSQMTGLLQHPLSSTPD